MDTNAAEKKYNVLENIIQKINQKYVALPEDAVKRNNQLLSIIDKIIQKMRSKNSLFDRLYQNKYYGGSYYDGLKVGEPCEYDLDCVLRLPKAAQPRVEVSDKPGFVHVTVNMEALKNKVDEAPKYDGLEKLLDDGRLSTKKVKSWMESLVTLVLPKSVDNVQLKIVKSGPALTIKMKGKFEEKKFNVDVDMVPCFTFFDDQWPKGNYRANPSDNKNTFFVVPKSPSIEDVHYWRLSFQEQERELINNLRLMKPTIRLIKKIRDRYQHSIASYYIKTVFLWEADHLDKSFWEKSLSFVFMTMLSKYADYISSKSIPYYWNEENNLIGDLSEIATACIANTIRNIVKEIDSNYFTQPYSILSYFLNQTEYNLEAFKEEVPLSKKHLKKLRKVVPELHVTTVTIPEKYFSVSSSLASSFEEINKEMVNESSSQKNSPTKLETLFNNLFSEQQRLATLLETVIEKIDNLDSSVKRLYEVMDEKITEEKKERNELVKMVSMLSKKIDDVVGTKRADVDLELVLPSPVDMLKRTVEFLPKVPEKNQLDVDSELLMPFFNDDMLKRTVEVLPMFAEKKASEVDLEDLLPPVDDGPKPTEESKPSDT